jgi:hypothetical protein
VHGEPDDLGRFADPSVVITLWSVGRAGLRRLSSFEGGITVAIAPDGRESGRESGHAS